VPGRVGIQGSSRNSTASTYDVIFSESIADILTNLVDICFGSMSAKSTSPAVCLVIESNAITSN
jgi:hypothetical protein